MPLLVTAVSPVPSSLMREIWEMPSPAGVRAPLALETVDYHTAGEPFRIVTGGAPAIPGRTVRERREAAREHRDQADNNEPEAFLHIRLLIR